MTTANGHSREIEQARWYNTLLGRALAATDDLGEAVLAAELAVRRQPFPHAPDAAFGPDIFSPRARRVLTRALQAVTPLAHRARKALKDALALETPQQVAHGVLDVFRVYRLQLAEALGVTQLAALLEGAREVASKLPPIPPAGAAVTPPPSLPPEEAAVLAERVRRRPSLVYELPADQQAFARASLTTAAGREFTPPARGDVQFVLVEEAARELASKNVVSREVYDRLDDAARAKAFTVAGAEATAALEKVRDALAATVQEGVGLEAFRAKVDPEDFLSDAHLENVLRTNVQAAYSDGQLGVLRHPFVRSGFPYAAYDAIHDDRARHNHLALESLGIDGTNVYRVDDPVFQTFRPPWDYNDRCSWTPLTVRQAAEKGVKEAQDWLASGTEPSPPAHVPMPAFSPPAGFRRDAAGAPLSVQLSALSLRDWGGGVLFEGLERPRRRRRRERIPGGLAAGRPDSDFDPEALAEGARVEREHTGDPEVAREIAKDHLAEDPDYYKKLKEVEGKKRRRAPRDFEGDCPECFASECPGVGWTLVGEGRWRRETLKMAVGRLLTERRRRDRKAAKEAGVQFGMVGDEWHGPKPPGAGWVELPPGPKGGKRWKRGGGDTSPQGPPPQQQAAPAQGQQHQQPAGDRPPVYDPEAAPQQQQPRPAAARPAPEVAPRPQEPEPPAKPAIPTVEPHMQSVVDGYDMSAEGWGLDAAAIHAAAMESWRQRSAAGQRLIDPELRKGQLEMIYAGETAKAVLAKFGGDLPPGMVRSDLTMPHEAVVPQEMSPEALGMTQEEMKAVKDYTNVNGPWKSLNNHLRGRGTLGPRGAKVKQHLDAVFARAAPSAIPVVVWRGLKLTGPKAAAMLKQFEDAAAADSDVEINGYISTSTSPNTASGFERGGVLLEIAARKGIDADRISSQGERELLLNHGSKFRVKAIREVLMRDRTNATDKVRVIQLEQVV